MSWRDLEEVLAGNTCGGIQKALLIVHGDCGGQGDSPPLTARQASAAARRALSGGADLLAAGVEAGLKTAAGAPVSRVIQVQYNPAQLTIQANAESIPFTLLQQNVDSGVPSQNIRPPMVVLSVPLYFDDMNPQDAFMADRLNFTAGNLARDAVALSRAGSGGHSVQPQTNGLLSLFLRSGTRAVTFLWGDVAFTGHVIEAEAEYTMFSASGRPVRSTVRLNIAQQVESGADFTYWNDALDRMFQDGDSVISKGLAQTAGSLLNLNFI